MSDAHGHPKRNHWPQMIGSLLVAVAIVAIVIIVVVAKVGSTPLEVDDHGGDKTEQEDDNSGHGS